MYGGGTMQFNPIIIKSKKFSLTAALVLFTAGMLLGACSPKDDVETSQPETAAPQQQDSAQSSAAPEPVSEPVSEPEAASVQYTYDAVGRLVSADYGAARITYTYDDNGNLLTRETTTGDSSSALPFDYPAAMGVIPLQAEMPTGSLPNAGLALTLFLSAASFGVLLYGRAKLRRRGRTLPLLRILVNAVVVFSLLLMPAPAAAEQLSPPADNSDTGDPEDGPTKESTTHTQSDSRNTTMTTSDPISTATGEYFFDMSLLDLGGPLPLRLDFYYGSQVVTKRMDDGLPGRFRTNQRPTLHQYRTFEPDVVFVEVGLGQEVGFHKTTDGWEAYQLEGVRYQLKETDKFYYFMDPIKEVVIIFVKFHQDEKVIATLPIFIIDRNGNQLAYYYRDDGLTPFASGPTRVADGLGRELRFTYQKFTSGIEPYDIPYLVKVEDQAGRDWTFSYEVAPEDNPMPHGYDAVTLRSMEDPMGNVTTFHYSDIVLISGVEKPEGNTPYVQTYDTDLTDRGVVLTQTDAYGNTTQVSPDVFSSKFEQQEVNGVPFKVRVASEESQFTVTNPDGAEQTYTHSHEARVVSSYTDAEGNMVEVEADPVHDQITAYTDRLGDTTQIEYHPESGKLEAITNANGDTISISYVQQEQSFTNPWVDEQVEFTFYKIGQVDYADGSGIALSYDERGNVTTWEGPVGETLAFTYNDRGQVLSRTNQLGGVTSYAYNEDGTLAALSDPERGETTYTYDEFMRLVQTTNPDGTFIKLTYDLNDRLTAVTNENAHSYRFAYDMNGNVIEVTDPLGEKTVNEYDLLDRLSAASDPLGSQTMVTYDAMGRLEAITNPAGVLTQYGYDANGWLNEVNIGGHSWTTTYDAEGIPVSVSSPLDNTTIFESDRLGFISTIRDPLGSTIHYVRDNQNRITGLIDPLGHETAYRYDGRGSLSAVTLPEVGEVEYSWNDLGLLTEIVDFNGASWMMDYSPMGRMLSLNDPLGNMTQFEYGERGRMSGVVFPDGESQAFTYDPAGRLLQRAGDGFALDFAYDDLNRITETEGLSFTYDALGRTVETRSGSSEQAFGAVYDDGGRVASATYGEALTVNYEYDPLTGLLARVSDTMTGSEMIFIYDDDFRLIGVERSNGVNGEYSWDDASRLTGIEEGSLLALEMAYDAAGQVVEVTGEAPVETASALAADEDIFEYDAASQITASGYAYDLGSLSNYVVNCRPTKS
jgi:YD repeat-containing protein